MDNLTRTGLLSQYLLQKRALASFISPLALSDLEGRLTYANPAALQAWGYDNESEVQGHFVREFWKDAEQLASYVDKVRAMGQYVGNLVARRKDGSQFEAEVLGSMSHDDHGRPIGIVASFIDVTAKKRDADRLRESDERLRLLLDSTAEAIFGVDLQGNCTFCNLSCVKILGYERAEDLLGKNMHALTHYSRADGTPISHEECPILRTLQGGEAIHAADEVFWRADGTSFPIEYWSHPQRAGDKIVGGVVAFIDITERKLAERALHRSEAKHRQVFESVVDGIMIFTLEGRVAEVNPAACAMYGYERDEFVTLEAKEFIHPSCRHLIDECHEQLNDKGRYFVESVDVRKDGSAFPVEIHGTTILFNGEVHLLAIVRDITVRKLAEEALRASEEKYRQLIENTSDVIYSITEEGLFRFVSPAWSRLLGHPVADVEGHSFTEFVTRRPAGLFRIPPESDGNGTAAGRCGIPCEEYRR